MNLGRESGAVDAVPGTNKEDDDDDDDDDEDDGGACGKGGAEPECEWRGIGGK